MRALFFDTETTGLMLPCSAPTGKQPHIIELGILAVNEEGEESSLSQLLRVDQPLDPIITKITGIKDEDLVGMPTFSEFLPKLIEFFKDSDFLVCHNATFDCGVLAVELARAGCDDFPWPAETICTVQEYRHKFGFRPSLEVLCERLTGSKPQQTHRALDDVRMMYDAVRVDGFMELLFGH